MRRALIFPVSLRADQIPILNFQNSGVFEFWTLEFIRDLIFVICDF
jgi:hypothetical protein